MADDCCFLNVRLSVDLRKAAAATAKELRTSTNQLINAALTEKLESIKEKKRREEAVLEEERAKKAAKRHGRIGSISLPTTLPSALSSPLGPLPTTPRYDQLEKVYEKHARDILAAGGDEAEIRRRVAHAIAAVRRERPLTSPPEGESSPS